MQRTRNPLPPRCPPRLAALIERCWVTEPRQRPQCSEVVAELQTILEETQLVLAAREGQGAASTSDGLGGCNSCEVLEETAAAAGMAGPACSSTQRVMAPVPYWSSEVCHGNEGANKRCTVSCSSSSSFGRIPAAVGHLGSGSDGMGSWAGGLGGQPSLILSCGSVASSTQLCATASGNLARRDPRSSNSLQADCPPMTLLGLPSPDTAGGGAGASPWGRSPASVGGGSGLAPWGWSPAASGGQVGAAAVPTGRSPAAAGGGPDTT